MCIEVHLFKLYTGTTVHLYTRVSCTLPVRCTVLRKPMVAVFQLLTLLPDDAMLWACKISILILAFSASSFSREAHPRGPFRFSRKWDFLRFPWTEYSCSKESCRVQKSCFVASCKRFIRAQDRSQRTQKHRLKNSPRRRKHEVKLHSISKSRFILTIY